MITVLGASGFIGSHLVCRLQALGLDTATPGRDEDLRGRDLGTVVDCAGVTDHRERPLDAVEAHVCRLKRLLQECRLESLVYLSTLSVYRRTQAPAREEDPVTLEPASDLYAISKAMGESLVLAGHPRGRVARLASVYGPDRRSTLFLPSVLREVASTGRLTLRSAPASSRDYVSVHDVADCVARIAIAGRHRLYNVGSGRTVSNGRLAERLAELTGCEVTVAPGAPVISYPAMEIGRLRAEFGFQPADLIQDLPSLLGELR